MGDAEEVQFDLSEAISASLATRKKPVSLNLGDIKIRIKTYVPMPDAINSAISGVGALSDQIEYSKRFIVDEDIPKYTEWCKKIDLDSNTFKIIFEKISKIASGKAAPSAEI